MKVLLITGGNSSEREVSLNSAENVKQALVENRHQVEIYDLNQGYAGLENSALQNDILFPVLHGEEGEGGKLHEFLSKINKPIVGTRNYQGLMDSWFKINFKKYCDANGIKTAAWKEIKSAEDIKKFGFPCVLKASNGGSSKEVAILKTKNDLKKHDANRILKLKTPVFVEKFLEGTEVTATIVNNKSLPLIEIIPPDNSWFSYENKYSSSTKEIPFAPSVPKKIQKEIQDIAEEIHKHFNLGSYSRMDFIIFNNSPYILEVNTIPGLTSGSLIPKSAKASGISFNEFIEILLRSAS